MSGTDHLMDLLGEDAVDLGSGHWARFTVRGGARVGFFHVHPAAGGGRIPEGEPCAGSVTFAGPEARWILHSLDPLHVEPSILCSCGRHGFVRGGKWEEC